MAEIPQACTPLAAAPPNSRRPKALSAEAPEPGPLTDHARERARLIEALVDQGVVRDARVRAALERIPREHFVPRDIRAESYVDAPLPIGEGQTISAPHMVAIMAEALELRPGLRVLEVGGGSGYHAAVLAELVQPGGRVLSVEVVPALAAAAREALDGLDPRPAVDVVLGDGSRGHPAGAPYDRISVACAAPRIPPPLLEQLAEDGLLVIPVGPPDTQELLRVRKSGASEPLGLVRFVPLVGEHGYPG